MNQAELADRPAVARLHEPIDVGAMRLANRIVMAPMTRNRALSDGTPSEMMATYYRQRASAGLIITEATYVVPEAKGYPRVPGIVSARHADGWKAVVDGVHEAGGKIALQLWHSGRVSHSSLIGHGIEPVAPSAIAPDGLIMTHAGPVPYETPTALTAQGIAGVIAGHVVAARTALEIGFDAVEIHAGNGYLLDQFLRDGPNRRTDAYGGSVENRARLTLEVVDAVAQACGGDRVGVRLSPFNAANSMADSDPHRTFAHVAGALSGRGLAFLHVTRMGVEKAGEQAFDIAELGRAFGGTFIVNGGYSRESGAAAIQAGEADLVAYGAPYTSNPDLVERFRDDARLAKPDPNAFYSGKEAGYIDFPPYG
jgi:N-ethylmaleimide reductase